MLKYFSQLISDQFKAAAVIMSCNDQIDIVSSQILPLGQETVDGRFQHAVHGQEISRCSYHQDICLLHFLQNLCHVIFQDTLAGSEAGVAGPAESDLFIVKGNQLTVISSLFRPFHELMAEDIRIAVLTGAC